VPERAEIQRWMTAAADGDRAAIEPLFQALWPVLVGYATRFLGDPALAEDAAQEAIAKLFARLPGFDRERDALTWALTHATWECRTLRRRIGRRQEHPHAAEPADDRGSSAEERELARAAVDALQALGPRDREVIAASVLDDDELRRTIAPATFRKRLERALGRLRTSWRSRHGTL
jgi:RNA polymerase sigma-70 factor (ECF subfamily)